MSLNRLLLCAVAVMAIPTISFAADATVNICAVQATNTGDSAYIKPCDGWESQSGCADGDWIQWDASVFQGGAMYSGALAAMAQGKTVTVRLSEGNCGSLYDVTTMIRVND